MTISLRSAIPSLSLPLAALAWACFVVHLAFVGAGVGVGALPDWFFVDVVHNLTYIAAAGSCATAAPRAAGPARRGVLVIAAGMFLWGAANVGWTIFVRPDPNAPWPSIADIGWLAFYPAAYAGIALLVHATLGRLRRTLLIDGVITALAVAAFATAFVMGPIIEVRPDSALGAIVTLAYPAGDIVVLSLVAGALTIVGAGATAAWRLMAAGLALFAIGDAVYVHLTADDAYVSGTLLDTTWPAGMLLMAHASRRAASGTRDGRARGSRTAVAVPIGAALAAVGLLIYGNYIGIAWAAIALAALALAAAAARMVLTVAEVRGLARSGVEARTDSLTGLPNRRAFYEQLNERIAAAAPAERFAVLVLDMDGFKEINDTLGHFAGDAVLSQAGSRLQRALRRDDVVYRLGGDEFAAVLPDVGESGDAQCVAVRLEEAMRLPFAVQGIDLLMQSSAGIALFPAHGSDAESLFRHADVAMYQAKQTGSLLEIYSHTRDPNKPETLRLLADLQRALHTDELVLHYQPKVDAGGALRGVEALVRWHHPSGGMIAPGDFIPLAERTGLMASLTDVVLDRALDQILAWRSAGFDTEVAVNVAPNSLLDDGFVPALLAKLERRGLNGSSVRLEFTETAMMSDPERARVTLARLRALGVGMSLDDFGTGHSSLAHLKHLVVDELKIDRSFVHALASDADDAAIVGSTVDLARRLGLTVVAEGVETVECEHALRSFGPLLMQGYLIARPMPGHEIPLWLAGWRAASAAPGLAAT